MYAILTLLLYYYYYYVYYYGYNSNAPRARAKANTRGLEYALRVQLSQHGLAHAGSSSGRRALALMVGKGARCATT